MTDAESVVRADDEAKPGVTNLLRIYAALSGEKIDDIAARYGDGGYGGFKKDLGDLVADTFAPIRERTAKYLADPDALDALLDDGRSPGARDRPRDDGAGPGPLRLSLGLRVTLRRNT